MNNEFIRNRKRRCDLGPWLDSAALAQSRIGYGCPAHARTLVDLPLDEQPTCTDLRAYPVERVGQHEHRHAVGMANGIDFTAGSFGFVAL